MSSNVTATSRENTRRVLLIGATMLVAGVGYIGFLTFKSFDVSATTGAGIAVVASTVGIAAFFSPCSFPLLLTSLTRQIDAEPQRHGRTAFRFALGSSIGAVAFVALFGLVMSIGGAAFAQQFTFASNQGRLLRAVVATVLIVMGLIQIGRVRNPFGGLTRLVEPIDRARRDVGDDSSLRSHVLYGFGYLVAGFG